MQVLNLNTNTAYFQQNVLYLPEEYSIKNYNTQKDKVVLSSYMLIYAHVLHTEESEYSNTKKSSIRFSPNNYGKLS